MPHTLRGLRASTRAAPDDHRRHHALGLALVEREAFTEGIAALRTGVALNPDDPRIRVDLARALEFRGEVADAEEQYRHALRLEPRRADLWLRLGRMLDRAHLRSSEAGDALLCAIAAAPDHINAYVDLARQYVRHSTPSQAGRVMAHVVSDRGLVDVVPSAIACALHEEGRHEESLAVSLSLLHAAPRDRLLLLVSAASRTALRDYAGASVDLQHAVRWHPADKAANLESINHFCRLGAWDAAQAAFRRLMPHLRTGTPTLWDGEPAAGQVLLLRHREGYGDAIQFARFASLASARGLRVIVDASPRLVGVMKTIAGIERVVGPYDPRPRHDLVCHPAYVGLLAAPSDRPTGARGAYVSVLAARRARWRARIGPGSGARIGLFWKGSGQYTRDRHRDKMLSIECLQPLIAMSGVRWYSLQAETTEVDRAALAALSVIDLGSSLRDLADTAAAIEHLDLVISIDTAMPHLCGALGRPCWVMLPYAACWRWGVESQTTVWYDSLRLFRQSTPGGWNAVIESVRKALEGWLAARGQPFDPRSGTVADRLRV